MSTIVPPPDDTQVDPFGAPLRHLRRIAPPWASEAKTVCGRDLSDVASWLEFEDAKALATKAGVKRSQFLFCQVCLDRHRFKAATPARWEKEPAKIVADWAEKAAWRGNTDSERINAEVLALGDLVDRHREEFDALIAARASDDLAARRKDRRRRA